MAKNTLTKYFKVVEPIPQAKIVQDSEDLTGGSLYAAYSWYQRLVQGSSTRQTRYREYDTMDEDVDVSIALDTIAEEMTSLFETSGLPFSIEFQQTGPEVNPSLSYTLNTALLHWCEIHEWRSKLFPLTRNMLKYGDCFFKRPNSKIQRWEHLHPRHVLAAVVDSNDITKIIGWQIRVGNKEAHGSPFIGSVQYGQETESQLVTSDEMIRFTTNDDMSDMAPFGESVLRAAYRAHKQKVLLEDSIIIYRVSRAPERRVFKIDVGKMPGHRVKQYLEQIKNEMKQKKIPSRAGDGNQVESVYNPHSAQEDFYFAQRCLNLQEKIPLLDGRVLTLEELINEYNEGKTNFVYSINQQTGEFIPGEIEWAGITRRNAEQVRVYLNNAKVITCTPDHKFVLRDGTECEAQNLETGAKLMSLLMQSHKVEYVEFFDQREDTGCLTIKDPGNNHNFALDSGVYVKNSDGKGSSVETLPGGQNLGELSDLEYFENKVARGLRIPASYWGRSSSDKNPIFNDGRVGQAYIEELRFTKHVERLQIHIEDVCDYEFKRFLRDLDVKVDETSFNIRLHKPTNFAKYRQQELDAQRLNSLSSAAQYDMLSKRFILERYLQLSKDEIAENERLVAQEKGVNIDKDPDYLKKIYSGDGVADSNFGMIDGSTSGMDSFGGSDMTGGEETDGETPDEDSTV